MARPPATFPLQSAARAPRTIPLAVPGVALLSLALSRVLMYMFLFLLRKNKILFLLRAGLQTCPPEDKFEMLPVRRREQVCRPSLKGRAGECNSLHQEGGFSNKMLHPVA